MPKLEVNGYELDYTDEGAGDPVIFVHGAISDRRTWENQTGPLSDRFRVIAYSRRYYAPNESIPDGADYSMLQHVDDLAELISRLGTGPVTLVANSYGAYISLVLALRRNELIRSLVLCEPPVAPLYISDPPKLGQLILLAFTRPSVLFTLSKVFLTMINPLRAALRKGDLERAISLFVPGVLGEDYYRNLSDERREQIRTNLIPMLFIGSGVEPLSKSDIAELHIPTLLLHGAQSPTWLVQLQGRLHELLPDSRLIKIPDASHLMHEDNPKEFNRMVESFLKAG